MKYIIDKTKRPIYLQLYQQLRSDIIEEMYSYNSKLPSKRILAVESGVSTITVEHAYNLLCEEGYVEARERSGYYVIFQKIDGFVGAEWTSDYSVTQTSNPLTRRVTEDILDSGHTPGTIGDLSQIHILHNSYINPIFPVSIISKTMRKVLTEYGEKILEKSPNSGLLILREAIRHYLAINRGIHVDVEQIIIGSGAEYLYGLIVELLGRSRIIAIESPSYNKIEQVYRATEIDYELLPLTSDGIDSRALAQTRADILHTTPYRSYPSGVTASASKRHEYIRWSNRQNRYIIEDDFESEFSVSTKPAETLFALADQDNVIYMNTFSKTISPAIRVGYMVLPQKLVQAFQKKLGFYSCTVPTFEQMVLAELIRNGDFERHINRVRRNKRKTLELSE